MKKTGYFLVMFSALFFALEGLGYIVGADLDVVGYILGPDSMASGIAKIIFGFGGMLLMLMHCRCKMCRMAVGNMEECDECAMCKDGCTMHEMKCDGCAKCADGCIGHEM